MPSSNQIMYSNEDVMQELCQVCDHQDSESLVQYLQYSERQNWQDDFGRQLMAILNRDA